MNGRTDDVVRDRGAYDADLVDGGDLEAVDASSRLDVVGERRSTAAGEPTGSTGVTSGLRSRLASPLASLFSVRWFGVATVACLVGVVLAGGVPLPLSGYLGIFVAAGAVGLASRGRRYVEVALGGAIAAGLAVVFDVLVLVLLGVGVPLVGIAALLGAVVAGIGHYAGRDLRHGLTRDL